MAYAIIWHDPQKRQRKLMTKKLGYYAPIDFRKELSLLMGEQGFHWVALRSVDLSRPCSKCKGKTLSAHSEVSSQCTLCLDVGYSYVDKLIKGYSYRGSPGNDENTQVGIINTENLVWALQHNSYPKTSDYILELDLDLTTGVPRQPFRIIRTHKVSDAQAMLGDDRKIKFWRCFTQESNLSFGRPSA